MNRDIYEFRFSTNPADFGYDGTKSNWLNEKPSAIGTENTILINAEKVLKSCGCGHGSSTFYASEYRHKKSERVLARHDLQMIIYSKRAN